MTEFVWGDAETVANIRKARHVHGLPPEHRLVPYHNIRHLLSQHAKTSGGAPYLIYLGKDGEREQLSYTEFNARVHQVANLLHDDFGVQRGDTVATVAHNHSDTVLIYFACWVIGARVAPQNVTEDDRRIAFILRNSEAKIVLARAEYLARVAGIVGGSEAEGLGAPSVAHIVQVGGEASEAYPHFDTLVKNLPYTYMGDGAPVKSSDDAVYVNDRVPTLDDEALLVYTSGRCVRDRPSARLHRQPARDVRVAHPPRQRHRGDAHHPVAGRGGGGAQPAVFGQWVLAHGHHREGDYRQCGADLAGIFAGAGQGAARGGSRAVRRGHQPARPDAVPAFRVWGGHVVDGVGR
jgi:hypothetical protein